MKTWKKIEDTRKRTNEIVSLKNRNEDRIKQVSWSRLSILFWCVERARDARKAGDGAIPQQPELHDSKVEGRREAQSLKSNLLVQD